jgi:Ca-activated chloride channel family protein
MRKAAEFGRGTFTYVGSTNEVSTRMDELFRKLESPKLADLEVDWGGAVAETWPVRVPDLYAGEPLVVVTRLDRLTDRITLDGSAGDPWRVVIPRPPLSTSELGAGIGQLWARRKIEALMDAAVSADEAQKEALRRAVIDVALAHHMVSKHTSLVAVDVTPTRPDDATLLTRDIPVNVPFGSVLTLPSTATPAPLYAVLALLSALTALILRRSAPSPARERAG